MALLHCSLPDLGDAATSDAVVMVLVYTTWTSVIRCEDRIGRTDIVFAFTPSWKKMM